MLEGSYGGEITTNCVNILCTLLCVHCVGACILQCVRVPCDIHNRKLHSRTIPPSTPMAVFAKPVDIFEKKKIYIYEYI